MTAPYMVSVSLTDSSSLDRNTFPGNLEFTQELDLIFTSPVTFFVGENGSGKSTLLEAMAVLSHLPISGGGMNETDANHAIEEHSILANSLRLGFVRQPHDRYFFRADTQAHFATLLEQRRDDPDFKLPGGARADPFKEYGGRSLHRMSHGEAFLAVLKNRFRQGFFLMDEPESALSPQRQLALLVLMHNLIRRGSSQFIAATHSPILLTFPGATIISFDHGQLRQIDLEETSHFKITKNLLNNPESYWRHLSASANDTEPG
ncbi:MAG: AAA family ATPase [Planctomycetaceae bacterium]